LKREKSISAKKIESFFLYGKGAKEDEPVEDGNGQFEGELYETDSLIDIE
jgi:hypothetical protein